MMRALVLDEGLALRDDMPMPQPTGDQALLKLRRGGVCNTDLELVAGYMNFRGVLGHEFVAEVAAGDPAWVGQRVVGEINVACGACDLCGRGIPSQCRHRTTVGMDRHDGAFAEYMALTARNLHRVPDAVNDDAATFTEPLAAALHVLEAVHVRPHDRVILLGAGKLGMLVAQVLKQTGADVLAVARREKQARLLERWGVIPVERRDLEAGRAAIVVDCTGNESGFADALALVEPRGTVVLKSTYHGTPRADLTRVAVDEIRVVGSRCGSFAAALRMLAMGTIDTNSLIEARYPLADAIEAMRCAAQPGMLKVLLEC